MCAYRHQAEKLMCSRLLLDSPFVQCVFHTPICIILLSPSSLKLCAFEWLQSSSSWEVAVWNRVSLPKVPPAPSLNLGLPPTTPSAPPPPPLPPPHYVRSVPRGPPGPTSPPVSQGLAQVRGGQTPDGAPAPALEAGEAPPRLLRGRRQRSQASSPLLQTYAPWPNRTRMGPSHATR